MRQKHLRERKDKEVVTWQPVEVAVDERTPTLHEMIQEAMGQVRYDLMAEMGEPLDDAADPEEMRLEEDSDFGPGWEIIDGDLDEEPGDVPRGTLPPEPDAPEEAEEPRAPPQEAAG